MIAMQRVVKKIITAIFSDLFLLDIRSINLNLNIQNLQSKLKNLFYLLFQLLELFEICSIYG